MRRERLGLLFILCSITGYAFLPIFAAGLRDAGLPPIETTFWRYFFALPFFVLIAFSKPLPSFAKPLPRLGLFLVGFGLAGEGLAAFIGLQYIPAGIYLVLFYTYPAMTALFSSFLGERLNAVGWFALALTLLGVMLTVADFDMGSNPDLWIGVVCALVNAFLAAIYFIAMGRLLKGHSSTVRAGAYTVSGSLVFLAVLAVGGGVINGTGVAVPQGANAWLNLAALVLISTVMPIIMLNKGIQAAGATRAAIFGTIEPLLTAVLAQVILGELMQPVQWLGGVIVIASVILLQLRGGASAESVQPAPAPTVS